MYKLYLDFASNLLENLYISESLVRDLPYVQHRSYPMCTCICIRRSFRLSLITLLLTSCIHHPLSGVQKYLNRIPVITYLSIVVIALFDVKRSFYLICQKYFTNSAETANGIEKFRFFVFHGVDRESG